MTMKRKYGMTIIWKAIMAIIIMKMKIILMKETNENNNEK